MAWASAVAAVMGGAAGQSTAGLQDRIGEPAGGLLYDNANTSGTNNNLRLEGHPPTTLIDLNVNERKSEEKHSPLTGSTPPSDLQGEREGEQPQEGDVGVEDDMKNAAINSSDDDQDMQDEENRVLNVGNPYEHPVPRVRGFVPAEQMQPISQPEQKQQQPEQQQQQEEVKEVDTCSICTECYHNNKRVLHCTHGFHSWCITTWLQTPGQPDNCPFCRTQLTHEDKVMLAYNYLDDLAQENNRKSLAKAANKGIKITTFTLSDELKALEDERMAEEFMSPESIAYALAKLESLYAKVPKINEGAYKGFYSLPKGNTASNRIGNIDKFHRDFPQEHISAATKKLYMLDKEFVRLMKEKEKTTRILQAIAASSEMNVEEVVREVEISVGNRAKRKDMEDKREKSRKRRAIAAKIPGLHFPQDD